MKIAILFGLLAAVLGQDNRVARTTFCLLDEDMDGIVRKSEAQDRFNEDDVNGDGIISFEEFSAAYFPVTPDYQVQATFAFYDKLDGIQDGVVSLSANDPYFSILDPQNDNEVTFQNYEEGFNMIIGGVIEEIEAILNVSSTLPD